MKTALTYKLFVCFLFVAITILSFYKNQPEQRKPRIIREGPNISTEPITAVGNRTFIIAPYYDPRDSKKVRVLSIVHVSVTGLYCSFHCLHNQKVLVRGQVDIHRDRFGFQYGTADILCSEPTDCEYNYISIQESNSTSGGDVVMFKVRNHPPQLRTDNFTVCISALFGQYNNVLQMIQGIEMYRLLGASRVTIYNNSCSPAVDKVLRYYQEQGIVEVVPWPIDHHLQTSSDWHYTAGLNSQIGYYGQTAALNDCIYRNMYRSKYVLLNDIDEIILPVTHWNWTSLMADLQRQFPSTSVFCIENHVFPKNMNESGFDLWTDVPGTNILNSLLREPINWSIFNDRKLIINPRDVFQTSIHSVLKSKGQSTNLRQNLAITFHCTKSKRPNLPQGHLIMDQTLRRYNQSLVPNVHKVVNDVFSMV
ncbi:beta-1,4-galactosyltransferase galt-1-like [Anomaloglossus baeobatrachus]|uniref:beta-1,4-galactosyltransferase galt-1-like n=1 Tax=Anomaloglossus baeobatrachus TaxID=238106 RepID=UPI003F502D0A